MKSRKTKKIMLWIILIICLCAFVFSGYKLFTIFKGYHDASKYYETVQEYSPFKNIGEDEIDKYAEKSTLDIDVKTLKKTNPDFFGWLFVKNTKIDYPVVAPDNNEYYLNRDFNRNYLANGCLFMDSRCEADLSDFQTIIYGHHMRDGSMFGQLEKYKDYNFFKSHQQIMFVDRKGILHKLKVFSVHTTPSDSFVYMLNSETKKARRNFVEKLKEKSLYDTGIYPADGEHIITLSTCAYEYEGARFVVHTIVP